MGIIDTHELVFDYPGKRALKGVSCSIEPGSVTALVGPNGAGKSTLMRCMAGLEIPFSGSVTVDGIDTQVDPRKCHEKIGYLADFFGLYEDLTVEQSLTYMARIHGFPSRGLQKHVHAVADEVSLLKYVKSKASELSRGLRQRLAIAQAIIHRPEILLLDEPAAGLDPEARHELSALICSLNERGATIIVSSHILAELSDYSSAMITVQDGQLVAQSSLAEKQQNSAVQIEIELLHPSEELTSELSKFGVSIPLNIRETKLCFEFSSEPEKQHLLLKSLLQANVPLFGFRVIARDIRTLYLEQLRAAEKGEGESE